MLNVFPLPKKQTNKQKTDYSLYLSLPLLRGHTKFNTRTGFVLEVVMTDRSPKLKVTTDEKHSDRHLK